MSASMPIRLSLRGWVIGMVFLFLGACGSHIHHVVEPGETLYSIGWIYGYDYRQIAKWNNIPPPYKLRAGQRLKVVPPTGEKILVQDFSLNQNKNRSSTASPTTPTPSAAGRQQPRKAQVSKPAPAKSSPQRTVKPAPAQGGSRSPVSKPKPIQDTVIAWRWPTKTRRLLSTYSSSDPARQGIGIAGQRGSPIYASADGYVVYAGSGLPRYGRLIIVKHNDLFLSAYAHNHRLRVKEGDVVKAGQEIADMGRSGTDQTKLYFEIRRNGKPVDPLRYLPN